MIVINSGKMQIPEADRFIGFCGDNLHSQKQFMLECVTERDCIYRLYLSFDDGTVNYFVLDSKVENGSTILTWDILEEHIFKSGTVQAQIKCISTDGEIYHTTKDYFIVANSAQETDFFSNKENSEFLRYERVLNSLCESIKSGEDVYVPASRQIANISLNKDITAEKLNEALKTYPILVFNSAPDTSTKGNNGQIGIYKNTSNGSVSVYYCGGGSSGYTQWVKVADTCNDIDLSDYVPTSRTIAGVDLKSNITKDKLRDALSTYPILTARYEATSDLKGEYGQLCLGGTADKQYKLYFCTGGTDEKGYDWTLIGGVGVIPDNAVPTTRTIADIDLSGDITADDLQEALDTYPIYTSSSLSDIEENLKIGQLALYTTYDGKTWVRDIYYRYSGGLYLIGGTTFNNNMLPDAIKKYLDESSDSFDDMHEYASRIQGVQSPTTLTLALMADTHYCDNNANAKDKLDTANKMALLSNYVHVDAIANLGDFVNGDEQKDITKTDLAKLIANTNQNAKCPVFYLRGNHDNNSFYGSYKTDDIINNTEWYQMAFGFTHKDVVIDTNKPDGGYGYYDHSKSKIRVFLLNSSDSPVVVEDGSYRYGCCAFSNEQLNFVANALQFEDKDNPNEWAAMFLMHVPLDTTRTSGYHFGCKDAIARGTTQMLSIISAYRKGTSYSFTGSVNNETLKDENGNLKESPEHFEVAIDVDYSDKGAGDVICFVSGHTHVDNCSQKVGYEGSLSYGYTYLGIIGNTSFATMVVDRENSIVTTFKYGDVITLSDMGDRDDYEGMIDGETEFEIDMETGVWAIPFNQFRQTNDKLYNGLSKKWEGGYTLDTDNASLDTETLEVKNAIENSSSVLSKGVAVKGSAQYAIPSEFVNGTVYIFNSSGGYLGTKTPTASDGCQIITTTTATRYIVFRFHKPSYPDYENFYIKEYVTESGDTNA